MTTAIFLALVASTLAYATPLLLAALGELVGERSGTLNIGLEGMMLCGALAGAAGSFAFKSAPLGLLAAMLAVPRHLFLEPGLASQAYIDASLPIGHHQTISQPYIVARMIEVLRANGNGGQLTRVLEIGTGCGYQAAVLSRVATEVYSVERIKALHELAKANLLR